MKKQIKYKGMGIIIYVYMAVCVTIISTFSLIIIPEIAKMVG